MLILLQPGIEPLGQFDLEDDDTDLVVGGEVARFQAIDYATDGYAADVFHQGPPVHLVLDEATDAQLHGLVDEGTSTGLDGKSYGTMFGEVIGAVAGQGTGVGGTPAVGTVTVGPSTLRGSGKATLWTKPGLYGVTSDAWGVSAEFDAATLNDAVYGDNIAGGATRGKLTTTVGGAQVAVVLGLVSDTSLVSTTSEFAGATSSDVEYCALYLLGVQA